ncbi:outer membrane beta-barrel protein [Sphingobacterium bovistauri]|uniref:Outer membrane beta-barrel protein n=1 Tax=Sphingobacterium bovistauri TaxID=2781959 RepID=A0ABS7Z662_9SPHI|nr:outer membrane beta-barrel protein [Sphingobacterium bovistauri]MCA5005686.1 outer membrane beta-barrel protein [Sphingobacterium bovistauri]
MKTFIHSALIFIALLTSIDLYAQHRVNGRVLSTIDSTAIIGATVRIFQNIQNSTPLYSSSTDKLGGFIFNQLKPGDYKISVQALGFQSNVSTLQIHNKTTEIVKLVLQPENIGIDEVVISASPAVLLKGDTLEYDAKRYVARDFADADEIVSQIPGVMIDEDGNVTAHGEQVTRIIVDGKEFFSSDPKVALKNLPADIIAKIQLIDEKSEQARFSGFDDGKRNKVINIVTKPDKKLGYFGKSALSKGNSDKFSINSSTNSFNQDKKYAINILANNINETNFAEQGRGGNRRGNNNTDRGLSDTYAAALTFSNTYPKAKLELSSDYNFNSSTTASNSLSNIQYLSERQSNQFRTQNQFTDVNSTKHVFGGRVKWQIDSIQRLDFSPNLQYTTGERTSSTDFNTINTNELPINKSERSTNGDNSNLSFGGSLTYMLKLKKPGRTISLSATGNKNTNDAYGLNLAVTEYYKDALLNRIDTNNNTSLSNGHGSGVNARLSFTETISKFSRLQAQYNFRNNASYSKRETYEFLAETGQTGEIRDRLSNEFRNDFDYHSAGLSYIFAIKDSIRFQMGLQYQHGIRHNDRIVPIHLETVSNFNSFLPDLAARYKFKQTKEIEFNYNTSTNTPTINQLQDFINNQNELRITNGNPNLNQEYAHTLRLQYKDINKKTGKSLTTNINFDYIQNRIINSILQTDTSIYLFDDIRLGAGGQYIVPINADGAYSFRLNNSYGLPIEKLKINLNLNSRLYLNNELAKINNSPINNKTFGYGQSIGVNSKFSKRYVIGISYHIDGRQTSNIMTQTARYHVINHRLSNNTTIEPFKNIVISSNFMWINNGGIMDYPDVETFLWNASIGKKLFKKSNAEITLKGFDLLNSAKNISRRVTENNISDVTSNTLNRYFLLSFTYNLRKFGTTNIFK